MVDSGVNVTDMVTGVVEDNNGGQQYDVVYERDSSLEGGWRCVSIKPRTGPYVQGAEKVNPSWIQSQLTILGSGKYPGGNWTPTDTMRPAPTTESPNPGPGPEPLPGGGGANTVGGGTMMGAPVSPITGMPRSAWSQALHDAMSQWVPGQTPHPLSPQAQMKYDPAQGAFVSTAPPPPKWNPVDNIMAGKPAGYPMPPFDENGMIPNMPVPPVPEPAAQMAPVSQQMPVMPNVPTGQTMPALPNIPPPPPMSGAPQSGPWTGKPPFLNPGNSQFPGGPNPLQIRQGIVPMGPEAYLNQLVNNGPGSSVRKVNLG